MGVKLSKIKRLCLNRGQIRLYTADRPQNMIMQWLGIDGALYPVEGVTLTMDLLAVVWELSASVRGNLDVQEMSIGDAVENGLLGSEDAAILQCAAGMVDMAAMERIRLGRVFDHVALALGEDGMMLVPESVCAPCWWGDTAYEITRGETTQVLVYTDGQLSGVVRPADEKAAAVAEATLKTLARKTCIGA